jgi:hypothetical protein
MSHRHFLLIDIIQVATDRLVLEDEIEAAAGKDSSLSGNLEFPMQRSLEERYLEVMKQLQFGKYTYLSVEYIGDEQELWLASGKLFHAVRACEFCICILNNVFFFSF